MVLQTTDLPKNSTACRGRRRASCLRERASRKPRAFLPYGLTPAVPSCSPEPHTKYDSHQERRGKREGGEEKSKQSGMCITSLATQKGHQKEESRSRVRPQQLCKLSGGLYPAPPTPAPRCRHL